MCGVLLDADALFWRQIGSLECIWPHVDGCGNVHHQVSFGVTAMKFDLWWIHQEEMLIEEGFSWEEIQEAKELCLQEYERGFEAGQK